MGIYVSLLAGGCQGLELPECTIDQEGLPVFPGAEGFGTRTPAGRSGRVMEVTSLKDDGPGSLREGQFVLAPKLHSEIGIGLGEASGASAVWAVGSSLGFDIPISKRISLLPELSAVYRVAGYSRDGREGILHQLGMAVLWEVN